MNAANADTAASSADKVPDSGALSVAPEFSDVPALVDRARSTFVSGGRRHSVLVDLPAGRPLWWPIAGASCRCSTTSCRTLRGTRRSRPAIRVAAGLENAHVAGSVSDEGSGVAPERLPHMFSKHAGAGRGAMAGHGHGLVICKGLVEAHGGRIRAESLGAGRGTVVTFTVPVAGEAAAAAVGRAAVAPAAPEPRRAAAHPGGRR